MKSRTPAQIAAAAVVEASVEGSDLGKYEVAETLGRLEPDDVDRVLA